ncbi:hypothetical protein P879_03057 [Paragonimus westermani]|uniref:E3 ubiquitin-protein ligase n=1 Tax=Paragonimus westermani TaxID=34504 RepID=A0A8T0DI32_9TREM|nr:hypothetical protein P879_03057 [Paragonimus westermani]
MANGSTMFLLNLLQSSVDSTRDIQLTALEQLCSLLLQTNSAEVLKKEFPPSCFIPVLIKFFIDFESPPALLESAARLLEELVRRDSNVLKLTNCISSIFEFISSSWKFVHLDTLRSGLFVAGRIASFLDLWLKHENEIISEIQQPSTTSLPPQFFRLRRWIASLVKLMSHRDMQVSFSGLDCLHVIITACRRLPISWSVISQLISENNLLETFLSLLSPSEPDLTNREEIKCNERATMPKTETIELEEAASVTQDGERQACGTSDAACINLVDHKTCLTGPLATIVVDLILNLCQGQPNLFSIAESPALARLFQHALFDCSVDKSDANATKTLNSKLDGLIPILQLADGLLNLAMTLPCQIGQSQTNPENTQPSTNGAVYSNRELDTGASQNEPERVEKHDKLPALVGNQNRIMWGNYLKARLVSPGHNDSTAACMRSGLPAPPSLTSSSSSVASNSRQLDDQIPQAAFFAARQAFDHLGISDDAKLASECFHQWLANSLSNRANMADILSILQSGQINGCWMDSAGQTLLAWSLSTGHGAATLALCNRGVDVNAGLTASAIHYAIAYGQFQCVRRLLGHSLSPDDNQILTEASIANPRLRDYQGRTSAQLGLQAVASAIEHGTEVEQFLNQARLLQEAEDRFKLEVDENITSPFANLLKLTLPVLAEVYMNTTRPEIKLRALQIIARSVRSKTGFVVLYQMQKCSENSTTDGNISASNSRGTSLCNRLVQTIAHVLSQGSAEEVFTALTAIPALIDQPYFLTWMHRHGIPDLLAWRSKLYEQEISDQANSKEENDIVDKRLAEVSYSLVKTSVRETLPMCIPTYVKKPHIIPLEPEEAISSFQCLYELGQLQAYSMGDWYIMRTDLNSLLLFHEFAILWLEVSSQVSTTTTAAASVGSSAAVTAEEATETAYLVYHTVNAYLITRKEKCTKSDVPVVTPLLPVGRNSSAVSATEDSGQLNKTPSLYCLNSSEAVENLTVLQFLSDSNPVDKSELANDLWQRLLPMIVQIRHMFYGMLPLPISKSASPTSGPREANTIKQTGRLNSPVEAPKLQVPGCSTTHGHTSPYMSSTLSPGRLISRTCATSIGGHHSKDICVVKAIPSLCVVQTGVSGSVTPSSAESRQTEQQSDLPCTARNLNDKFAPGTFTKCSVVADYHRLSHLLSESPHDTPSLVANETNIEQPGATPQHMRVKLPDLSSKVTSKAIFRSPQSRPITSSDLANQHSFVEMTKDEPNKAEQIHTFLGREAQPESTCYNNGLSASGKVIMLHVGPIRLSLSPQGLWILMEPKVDARVRLQTTGGKFLDTCVHPECKSRWNPDCCDDVTDYNGKTVQFSCKTDDLSSQRPRTSKYAVHDSPRPTEIDSFVTVNGEMQGSKCEAIKILCHPTRLGGIRVYCELDKLVYQTGPITRSSGHLRLTRLLDNLSFSQRQYVRTKHRENRLKNIQQTIIRVALAQSNLLKRLMSEKLINRAQELPSPLFEKHLLKTEPGMVPQLTNFADCFCSASVPTESEANRRNFSSDFIYLIECLRHATPYEILSSQIIPQLYFLLKQKNRRERFKRYVWRQSDDWNESEICEEELSKLDDILTGLNLDVVMKKLIETLEMLELGRLISGESRPAWNTAELWAHCEPAAGYNRQSKGFLLLIEGLASFDASERRKFLRFVTGCPTLPPGGLRNLHPKLKVAEKDGSTCGPYPSVNTCMHYLKLPEYQTVEELEQHLLAAASQPGFYLN